MRFDILTLFPEVVSSFLNSSITGNAAEKEILEFNYVNIRNYSDDKHNRVDDYTFGGGPGMLLRPQPVFKAYNHILSECEKRPYTVYLSPRGKVFNQEIAKELASKEHIVFLCGHYEGVDQRVLDEVCDCELSIGDFVLTGGEIAAAVVCDAVSRLVPGVLAEAEGYENESHFGGLLEFPQYTRPREFNGKGVPDVLLSGNQKEIDKWRYEKSVEITAHQRPDMYEALFEKECPRQEKYSIKVLCNNKHSKKYQSYITKLSALGITEDENAPCYAMVSCGSEKLKNTDEKCGFCVILKDESEYEPQFDIPDYIKNEFYKPERLWCTSLEAAEETLCFVKAFAKYYKVKTDGCNTSNICGVYNGKMLRLIKPISYDVYENNITKFKNYKANEVFLADMKGELLPGEYTLLSDGDVKAINAELFTARFKNIGKKYVVAAKNLDVLYRDILDKKTSDRFGLIPGNVVSEIENVYRLSKI